MCCIPHIRNVLCINLFNSYKETRYYYSYLIPKTGGHQGTCSRAHRSRAVRAWVRLWALSPAAILGVRLLK